MSDKDRLLVRRATGPWLAPSVSGYAKESELQAILVEHPELLPGVGPEAVTCAEFESGVGPADVIVITEAGRLVVVECKLAYNPQARREIIGQVLDYASRIWAMSVDDLEERWRARTQSSPFDYFGAAGPEVRQGVQHALSDASFTLVLAVDAINEDLKRIVEYLNAITRDEVAVIAFEASRVAEGDVEILMPRVYGAELAEVKERRSRSNSWTKEEFLAAAASDGTQIAGAAADFLDEVRNLGYSVYNGTAMRPNVIIGIEGFGYWPVSVYSGPVRVRIRLYDISDARGPELAIACVQPLLGLAGVSLDPTDINVRRKLDLPAQLLEDPDSRGKVLKALQILRDGQPLNS